MRQAEQSSLRLRASDPLLVGLLSQIIEPRSCINNDISYTFALSRGSMKGLNRNVGAFLLPFVTGGGLPGVGIGVIWIPHYPAVAPTRVAACPVAPKKDSLLCKEVK